jgi:hypothetical protein
VIFQPAFGGAIVRAQALHLTPEAGGMIHLHQVGEFVQADVITDEVRGLDQAPVERDRAVPGTGTPAGPLIANRDPPDGQSMGRRQFHHAGGQFTRGDAAKMVFDRRAQVAGERRGADVLIDHLQAARRIRFDEAHPLTRSQVAGLGGRACNFNHCCSSQGTLRCTNSHASLTVPRRGMVTRAMPSGRSRSK